MPRRRKNEWRIWLPGGAGPAPSLHHCKWSAPNPRSGITSRSRGALRPRFASRFALRRNGGRREDRVLAAPAVPRAICANKTAHEHTGTGGASRPSLRNGFTAYIVLFPENGFLASVACASYRRLNASTAAPEPHDFTVRLLRVRLSRHQRPSHPTARS